MGCVPATRRAVQVHGAPPAQRGSGRRNAVDRRLSSRCQHHQKWVLAYEQLLPRLLMITSHSERGRYGPRLWELVPRLKMAVGL